VSHHPGPRAGLSPAPAHHRQDPPGRSPLLRGARLRGLPRGH